MAVGGVFMKKAQCIKCLFFPLSTLSYVLNMYGLLYLFVIGRYKNSIVVVSIKKKRIRLEAVVGGPAREETSGGPDARRSVRAYTVNRYDYWEKKNQLA